MNMTEILPKIANRAEIERIVGKPLHTLDAIQQAGYHLVQARDREEYYLAKETDLQPLLVRLGEIAEVRFGIKTGANEFFYLEPVGVRVAEVMGGKAGATVQVKNGAGWQGEIETAWLRPVIKSPRELKTLRVRPEDVRYLVFMPPDDARPHLHDSRYLQQHYPHAWAYIQWGERQGYHKRSTCAGRQRWWELGIWENADFIVLRFRHVRNWTPIIEIPQLPVGDIMFVGNWLDDVDKAVANSIVNTTLFVLATEMLGRRNLGEGLLTTYGPEITEFFIPNPAAFTDDQRERLLNAFEQMASREVKSIFEELGLPKPNCDYSNIRPEEVSLEGVLPDRRALDSVVFEVLGLSEEKQLEVYRAVVELVRSRLVRAQNVG